MYRLVRSVLFLLPAETAHNLTFVLLAWLMRLPWVRAYCRRRYTLHHSRLERELWGIRFRNPVGLAAGFDKNARLVDYWEHLGFGFVEIGTITPRPQSGNAKPRLFRLLKDKAILNRMGFNNDGVDAIARRLRRRKSQIVIGANIGKNKDTPNEQAVQDYLECFEKLFDCVDYFVVNVSSPNTPNLRKLQERAPLQALLQSLQHHNQQKAQPKPILLKIAPDLSQMELLDILEIVQETGIAGVIATNTTTSREMLLTPAAYVRALGAGGISGAPLAVRAREVLTFLKQQARQPLQVISVGGIMDELEACKRLEEGACLIQLYTGLVYAGPTLTRKILQRLLRKTLNIS